MQAHRDAVRDAVLSAVGALVREGGVDHVTMSALAERAGISRATLYRYFADSSAALLAWHQEQVEEHLSQLADVRGGVSDPGEALAAVLHAYAILAGHGQVEDVAALHRDDHMRGPWEQLLAFLTDTIRSAADAGAVRGDVPADELARYCVHALSAASEVRPGGGRLVGVVLDGLRGTTGTGNASSRHSAAH